MIGVRATRQILGDTSPTLHEVRNTRFSDTVAKPYAEDAIRLPYGSLLPQGVDNLLVAGRCIWLMRRPWGSSAHPGLFRHGAGCGHRSGPRCARMHHSPEARCVTNTESPDFSGHGLGHID